MNDKTLDKVRILTDAAKYDVSCSSSGSTRKNLNKGVGSAAHSGICHSYTADGRCVSLFKIMMTNYCIYDCAYCVNRRSNDVERTTFTIDELVSLTIEFYRRNYIEGLFLSSGVHRNPDYTMEQMIAVVKDLRQKHCFNGYIHMKSIPGASEELVFQAGLYADRMSVNLEIADEKNLKLVAPEKNYASIFSPMRHIQQKMLETSEDSKKMRSTPKFVPAGQSTQLIVGATSESDNQILNLASKLYKRPTMKRVYYSGYIPVNDYDTRLPSLKSPPLVRENRLYQADWLLRFYQFSVHEIVDDNNPNLDLSVDPKLGWALRNPHAFPIDVNTAPYEMILRVPGIGIKSAKLILASRRFGKRNSMQLRKIGVVMNRAQYFIVSRELSMHTINEIKPETIKGLLTNKKILKNSVNNQQLSIDWNV
ncbi:MAG: putative DNA modification/repair radical SAM protein [Bacteroidales bacterium]|nr:putative DNA modification/repair radical SAM protein [Bacteroidales bacterium]